MARTHKARDGKLEFRFMLLCGRDEIVPMPYSYARRAVNVLYRLVWKQIAVANTLEALTPLAADNSTVRWRAEDWSARGRDMPVYEWCRVNRRWFREVKYRPVAV